MIFLRFVDLPGKLLDEKKKWYIKFIFLFQIAYDFIHIYVLYQINLTHYALKIKNIEWKIMERLLKYLN